MTGEILHVITIEGVEMVLLTLEETADGGIVKTVVHKRTLVRTNLRFVMFRARTSYIWLTLLQSPKTSSASGQNDEEKKAERLAKLEAWKQKQKQAAEKNKDIQTAGGTRSLLDEIDRKAAGSPIVPSLSTPDTTHGDASLAPYAGKFDPKAIVKKATSGSTGVTKLGTDIALPEISKASGPLNSTHTGLKANKSTALAKPTPCKSLSPPSFLVSLTYLQLPHRQCH